MILIADSGSTKTSWCFSGKGGKKIFFSTAGINPFFRTSVDIVSELQISLATIIEKGVDNVFFYGAGVVNEEKSGIVRRAFSTLFPGARIDIQSDLLAAAHSTLRKQKGIACILGTGSNSCQYDGKRITEHVPPLGYILGDEGSGAVMGRKLLGDYLKKVMASNLREKFHEKFPLDYPGFLNRVYNQKNPNRFLAGLVPFLKENMDEEYCVKLVSNSFDEFIERNVSHYPGFRSQPICFVGSVAFHFHEQLAKVLSQNRLTPGVIIKDPLLHLLDYHLQFSK